MKAKLEDFIPEGRDSLLKHVLLSASCKISDKDFGKIVERLHSGRTVDVELTIGGHSVSVVPFFDNVEKDMERMIAEKAAELIREKFQSLSDLLYETENEFKNEVHKMFPDADLDLD